MTNNIYHTPEKNAYISLQEAMESVLDGVDGNPETDNLDLEDNDRGPSFGLNGKDVHEGSFIYYIGENENYGRLVRVDKIFTNVVLHRMETTEDTEPYIKATFYPVLEKNENDGHQYTVKKEMKGIKFYIKYIKNNNKIFSTKPPKDSPYTDDSFDVRYDNSPIHQ